MEYGGLFYAGTYGESGTMQTVLASNDETGRRVDGCVSAESILQLYMYAHGWLLERIHGFLL